MAEYKLKHHILTPDKQHELGAQVNGSDLGDRAEVARLLKLGAIEPLEGYTPPAPRPDQWSDPTPRGVVSSDWFAGGLTPEEIDAHIAALEAQRPAAVERQQRAAEAAAQATAPGEAGAKPEKKSKAVAAETPAEAA